MILSAFRDEIKLKLTGGLLEMEIDDSILDKIIDSGLREIQRYICSTKIITIPYKKCIDLSNKADTNDIPIKVSSVSRVYRAHGYLGDSDLHTGGMVDPMYVAQ